MKQYLKKNKSKIVREYNYNVIKIKFYKEFYVNDNTDPIRVSSNFLDGIVDLGFNQLDKISMYDSKKNIIWEFSNKLKNENTFYLYYYGLRSLYWLANAYTTTSDKKCLILGEKIINSFYKEKENIKNAMLYNDHAQAERIENLIYFYSINPKKRRKGKFSKKCISLIGEALDNLLGDKYYQKNHNHGILVDKACLIGVTFLKRYNEIDYVYNRLKAQMKVAYAMDGVHRENSVDYHFTILQNIVGCFEIFDLVNFNIEDDIKALKEKMYDFIIYSTLPSGKKTMFGDSKGGVLKFDYDNDNIKNVKTKGLEGIKPKELFKYFSSGYVFLREHFNKENYADSTWISIKAGYTTRIHKHQDDMSICLYSKGYDIFIDPGMYNYEYKNPIKDYVESQAAHTTIGIKNMPYSVASGNGNKFKIISRIRSNEYDYVCCVSNVYENVTIYRNLYYIRIMNVLIINDEIYSKEKQQFVQYYHLGKDIKIVKNNINEVTLEMPNKKNVQITQMNEIDSLNIIKGEGKGQYSLISMGFGKYETTETLEYIKIAQNTRFVTVINIDSSMDLQINLNDNKLFLNKSNENLELNLMVHEPINESLKNVEVKLSGNILNISNLNLDGMQHCIYAFDDNDKIIEKQAYTSENSIKLDLNEKNNLKIMYYLRNQYYDSKYGILCKIEKDSSGEIHIKKYDSMHRPKIKKHEIIKENTNYKFKVSLEYDYKPKFKWYVYKNGAQIFSIENDKNTFDFELVEKGDYVVMVSVYDAIFKEFDFYQYDLIKIDNNPNK